MSRRRKVVLFLLLFSIPILAAGVLTFFWMRGDITLKRLPEATIFNLEATGVLLAALVLVASLSLPAVHSVVRRLDAARGRRAAVLHGEVEGSRFASVAAFPLLYVGLAIAWPLRLVLILATLALLGAILVFAVRLVVPEFLQVAVDRATAVLAGLGLLP